MLCQACASNLEKSKSLLGRTSLVFKGYEFDKNGTFIWSGIDHWIDRALTVGLAIVHGEN